MARIVVEDVETMSDLLRAMAVVHQFFADQPAKFDSDEEVFSKAPPQGCDCAECREQEAREAELDRQVAALLPDGWFEDDGHDQPTLDEEA